MVDKNKLQEEIIKADIKDVEKLWKSNIDNTTLEILLDKMTKDELIKVAKKYDVKGLTSLKKAEVVLKIKNIILENYKQSIEVVDIDTLNFIKELVKFNGQKVYNCSDILYSNYLRNRGIVFTGSTDEELVVIIPEELKELLEKDIDSTLVDNAKNNSEIIKAIAGMTYYYGVININKVIDILNSVFNSNFELEYIRKVLATGEELGYDFVVDENLIYHIDVENVENVLELQKLSDKDYYKFDKKALIKAGVQDYIEENKQGEKIKSVLKELFVIDNEILKEEMDSFIIAIKNEMDKEEAIENFLEAYEIESDEEKEIFIYELTILAENIKRWSLKGYSEDEIKKEEQRVVNVVKIGRNEPCVCGSGKKYKKCCGK